VYKRQLLLLCLLATLSHFLAKNSVLLNLYIISEQLIYMPFSIKKARIG